MYTPLNVDLEHIARRVLARHLRTADVIGDPKDLLAEFRRMVEIATRKVSEVSNAKELQQAALDPTHPRHEEAKKSWKKYEFVIGVTQGYAWVANSGRNLFLTLLQVYDLSPKHRKEVEAAAKFFSRRGVNKPDTEKAIEVYEKYAEAYQKQISIATDIIATGKRRGEGGAAKGVPAGPFTVVNTGGFSDEVLAEAAQVVEKAAQLLLAKGLGRVCYGDVLLSNRISRSNVLAFYQVNSDEMFVRSGVKGSDVVYTVIHELAHRLHFKFLKNKDSEIHAIYGQLSRAQSRLRFDPNSRPEPGDSITENGKTYVAVRTSLGRNLKLNVEVTKKEDPTWKGIVPIDAWLAAKARATGTPTGAFVSGYAKSDYAENFAEMVAHYCLGKLPDDQVEMLKAVL